MKKHLLIILSAVILIPILANIAVSADQPIDVKSEIKPLKKVLLHRPGKELHNLTPNTLQRLLFDDIPFLKIAQKEHDKFAEILKENGVTVVYLENLAAEAIADPCVRTQFINQFIEEAGITDPTYKSVVYEFLDKYNNMDLILKTMEGIRFCELPSDFIKSEDLADDSYPFIADPMPNLYFTRDPFACIGNGVSLNKMFSETRNRETIYGEYIFNHHPEYKGKVTKYYDRYNKHHTEGGDVLNLNDRVLAIGISQRTQKEALESLAKNIFNSNDSKVETVLAFKIPNNRAMMHLDTVFTQVDYNKFTIHPGIKGTLQTFEIVKGETLDSLKITEVTDKLENILAHYLGVDHVDLISCGGNDRIAGEREQWNDGSNTLCIAPGVVIVYDRNETTNNILKSFGLTVIEMPSAELSRGRGGPRCMSMPLVREN